jgi:hypothetical protein
LLEEKTEEKLQERLKANPDQKPYLNEVRQDISGRLRASLQVVPPDSARQWRIDLGHPRSFFRNQPMQLRVKFNTADRNPNATFDGLWQVGEAGSTNNFWPQDAPLRLNMSPDTAHEIAIPANLCDPQGRLSILFINPTDTALSFPLEDGIQVLYPEGGFALNYARGLGVIWCWLALLTALGLTSASFLSFPVAAFFSLGLLLLGLSSGTLADAVGSGSVAAGNEETGAAGHSAADIVLIPAFKGALAVINLAGDFSPIDALSTGRSIPWGELGLAFAQIVLLLGGGIGLTGVYLFNRRELATAQGTQ